MSKFQPRVQWVSRFQAAVGVLPSPAGAARRCQIGGEVRVRRDRLRSTRQRIEFTIRRALHGTLRLRKSIQQIHFGPQSIAPQRSHMAHATARVWLSRKFARTSGGGQIAKVRNVSTMGSQFLRTDNKGRLLIPFALSVRSHARVSLRRQRANADYLAGLDALQRRKTFRYYREQVLNSV